jgi:hypothetical protein
MIELLTVLVIIGILVTISLVAYGKARDRSRMARVKSNVGEMVLALSDFARDHNGKYPALTDYHNNLPSGYTTTPAPPSNPVAGVPVIMKRRGNAIVGGSPPLADTASAMQDDFFRDVVNPPSLFRDRQGEVPFGMGPMGPVDQLVNNGQLDAYPHNPMAGPGYPMVNIAHILYDYDAQTNDFNWVEFTLTNNNEKRVGLCAALPAAQGFYQPIDIIWNDTTYPQGDFAYIPFKFTNEQGTYCDGYWIISYGDLTTLHNSDYNRFALDQFGIPMDPADPYYRNWPNLPPPYGDGRPDTPPDPLSFEYQVKRLIQGALDVRATVFEDQLVIKR